MSDAFILKWPNVDLVGANSLVAVHGKAHARIRNFLTNAINRPEALRGIAESLQPIMVSALESWVEKGRVKAHVEVKKVS